jgi:hypothetical protein
MRRQQLTETQIAALFDPPTDPRELIRHYTLSAGDLAIVHRCRGEHNRLGRALMLCYLRFPGRPPGFTGKPREAGLMHAMPARGVDANRPDVVQTLDQAEHRGRLCRLRHLAQPAEPALPAFRPGLRQRIQLAALLESLAVAFERSDGRAAITVRSLDDEMQRRISDVNARILNPLGLKQEYILDGQHRNPVILWGKGDTGH